VIDGRTLEMAKKPPKRIFPNKVDISRSPDNEILTINFGGPEDTIVHMPADQVTEFINALWKWRVNMLPGFANNAPLGQHHPHAIVGKWAIEVELKHGGRIAHIRHPGLGWLTFFLTKAEASEIATDLTVP
jgi:hypothetical protein